MSPILGIWASQNYSRYSLPTSFESIATTTVGAGGSSSITFSSIPSTYTHLQIRSISRDNRTAASESSFSLQFNGNTGNNYAWHWLVGDGSAPQGAASTSTSSGLLALQPSNSTTASVFGGAVIDILDYANTNKNKTIRTFGGFDANGSGLVGLVSALYFANTNAITSITILPFPSFNFQQYSSFALYGIKGA